MNFLLDTNVVSEWVKPRPDANVVSWLASVDEDRVFLSVISLAEIRHGIQLMAPGRRRDRLAQWLADELPARFENRILGVDPVVANIWGVVVAQSEKIGSALRSTDGFIAATAQALELTLVTRNLSDFQHLEIPLLDPWQTHENAQ